MVGAFIVIGMLALGPGPDADDVNVTRGVMSAAVALTKYVCPAVARRSTSWT